jgi:N-methylhydantoinase B
LGVETRFKIGGENTRVVTFGDGDVEPAFGLFGGKKATLNKIELRYPDGRVYQTTSKDLVENVPAGTVLFQQAGGGGGYGDSFCRDPELVAREVKNGIISIDKAKELYGVVLHPETLELDKAGTETLRKKTI